MGLSRGDGPRGSGRDTGGREEVGTLGVERVTGRLEFGQGTLYAQDALNRGGRRPDNISHIVRRSGARHAPPTTTGSLQAAQGAGSGHRVTYSWSRAPLD